MMSPHSFPKTVVCLLALANTFIGISISVFSFNCHLFRTSDILQFFLRSTLFFLQTFVSVEISIGMINGLQPGGGWRPFCEVLVMSRLPVQFRVCACVGGVCPLMERYANKIAAIVGQRRH
jgi:hypothetical protein